MYRLPQNGGTQPERERYTQSKESSSQQYCYAKKQTFLSVSADGISVVSLLNQGPASVINFGELFSISNHLLKVSPVVVYCG